MAGMVEPFPVTTLIFWPALALVMSLLIIPGIIRLAVTRGFVDQPGGRKQHEAAVPPVGGIAIFAVFGLISLFVAPAFPHSWAYFLALGLILVIGVIDDRRGVNAKLKFLVHFLSAFIVVIGGQAEITTLGNLLGFGNMGTGWMAIPFSVACVVYISNAINMMDGLDGLAGGKSLIIFVWMMAACAFAGAWPAFLTLAVLSGALLGFLYYNMRRPGRPRAVIFLGDAGSMALGLTIAWFAINLSQGATAIIPPVSVAWIIALPIIDSFGLLVARLYEGRPPFEPDRLHFHHHFVDAGFSPGRATVLILGWGAFLGAIGFVGLKAGIPEPVLGWMWVALWLGHALLVIRHEKFLSVLRKIRSRS